MTLALLTTLAGWLALSCLATVIVAVVMHRLKVGAKLPEAEPDDELDLFGDWPERGGR